MKADLKIAAVSCALGKGFQLLPVSCVIPAGTRLGIIGPSGCGKSTLLSLIGGHEALRSGNIMLGDRDISHVQPGHRGTATVFQDFALLPHLTVEENIRFGFRYNNNRGTKPRETVVRDVISKFRLESCRSRKPNRISGGEKQRTAIARALVNDPCCLLLDEPTASLGRHQRDEVASLLGRLSEDFADTTILLVTHDYEFAFSVCDRLAILNKQEPTEEARIGLKQGQSNRFGLHRLASFLRGNGLAETFAEANGKTVAGYLAGYGMTEEIVRHPPTIEVAEILGGHTILYGQIDSQSRFRTDDSAVQFSEVKTEMQMASPCAALVRTTDITLHADSECSNPLAVGTIDSIQFRGTHYRIGVKVGNNHILSDTSVIQSSGKWSLGQQVAVGRPRTDPLILAPHTTSKNLNNL